MTTGPRALGHDEVARRASELQRRFAALPITIAQAACDVGAVAVTSYPGALRPSSSALLRGGGHTGRGEHVGWTSAAHRAFAERIGALALGACATVGDVTRLGCDALAEPYDRAALEAAALDLALRQAATNPFRLIGVAPAAVRYVLSFERVADPVARAALELRDAPELELKVDADPAWSDATLAALAALDRVRVLDFKLTGTVAEHERAHRLLPHALLEDPLPGTEPWSPSLRARLSLDAAVVSVAALAAYAERPAAVNVKPGRIGGVLEALAIVAACARRGIAVYFGGMFEVGVGRAQVQTLAALLSPDGPNDVAPIAAAGRPAERPPLLEAPLADAGFAAW